ncbi:D-3-phosphoglycerate dehydrogenase-like isoform X2 [Vigna umbellata]|uniref:D-3-phosphoglycerate dehydrogenase-like isoform X2 n=1 Tax=Vigna umbellata TaxID=87088 RepID=UPI001F5FEFBB|nr:D-3-phosphoglycerate dehydrogenase-like isoform X2 [Vigna umbellata]
MSSRVILNRKSGVNRVLSDPFSHTQRLHHLHRTTTKSFFEYIHSRGIMESNGNLVKHVEKQTTRVLFCGPHFPASHEYTAEYLQNHPSTKVDVLSFEDVRKDIANYNVCIVKSIRLDSDIISRTAQMQLIMQYGVGLEGVDIDAATKHGIKVARIPSDVTGNSTSCAEMAIYLMLGLLRKHGALLVNIARGGIVDYEAVINNLESGHLGGLGTDVACTEPFNPDDQIFKFKNVIMSPHVAGVTEHSYRSMAKAVGEVVLQLHAGLPLTGIELVN